MIYDSSLSKLEAALFVLVVVLPFVGLGLVVLLRLLR